MASEAKLRGNKKYLETLDDIKVRVPKGKRNEYKVHAERKGLRLTGKKGSLNALVVDFLEKDMLEEAEALGLSLDEYRDNLMVEGENKEK